MENMKDIYIVLTNTGTILSRIIRLWTRDKNAHVSIALDIDLTELYSFGRLNPYNAFIGGFVKEGIDIGTFGRFKKTTTQVYSLSITDEQYEMIKNTIKEFDEQKDKYKFNIMGLLFAAFNKTVKRRNKLFCAEFVRYLLYNSNIDIGDCSLIIKPEDFKRISKMKLVYQGILKNYSMGQAQILQ